MGYTENDLEEWTVSLARALTSCGLGTKDVIQVSYGYGLFTGGLGLHYGAERIGATVIPTSVGGTERQIELMQDLGATAICCTPSYLLHLGEVAEKMGVSIKKDTKMRVGILGAEPWTAEMRTRIQDWLGIKAYDIYGTSELLGPPLHRVHGAERDPRLGRLCLYRDRRSKDRGAGRRRGEGGAHHDHPEEGGPPHRPLPDRGHHGDGQGGLRLRADPPEDHRASRAGSTTCSSSGGSTSSRPMIEHTLMGIPEVGQHFQIVVDRKRRLDALLVRVEVKPEAFSDKITDLMKIKEMVAHRLGAALSVNADVELAEPGSLPRFEGKAKRVIDRRKM